VPVGDGKMDTQLREKWSIHRTLIEQAHKACTKRMIFKIKKKADEKKE
jgi:hypothetical protein